MSRPGEVRTVSRRPGAGAAAAILCLGALAAPAAGEIRFREVSREWNLSFRHHHGGFGERYMMETMVGGVVLLDFDGDGDLDVFWVDGGQLPEYQGEKARSRLLRNDGPGRFVDVTERAGIALDVYACGGAAGDVEGDGDPDLYVTAFGENRLFLNRGDGTFVEDAAARGVADPLWSSSAAFADPDHDGDLDLYVVNYTDFGLDNHKFCGDRVRNLRGYCHPGVYEGLPDRFYRNRGDGVFDDVTQAAGLASADKAGLGLVFFDLDNDGWEDVYVANDTDPNIVFRNRGDGTFEDLGMLSGASHSAEGRPEAGMGVDAGDVDGDGFIDVVVTNFEFETNVIYKNTGLGLFIDARYPSGVAEESLLMLAFGVALADLDHDTDLDLAVANGHILDNAAEFNDGSSHAQQNQVFENEGGGRFRWVEEAGLDVVRVSRGLAAGDLDGDGDLDLAVVNSNQDSEVYENVGADAGWLQVDLVGSDSNRSGIGARLTLAIGGAALVREVRTASSYLSQGALTAHFGLGEARPAHLTVAWPGGKRQRFAAPPAGKRLQLHE